LIKDEMFQDCCDLEILNKELNTEIGKHYITCYIMELISDKVTSLYDLIRSDSNGNKELETLVSKLKKDIGYTR